MSSFLSKILELIIEAVPCQRAVVLLMDEKNHIVFRDSWPLSSIGNNDLKLAIAQLAIKRMNPIVIEDLRTEPFFKRKIAFNTNYPGSVACVPFDIKNMALGVLYLERSYSLNPFSDKDLDLLIAFLRPIGFILQRYVEVQKFRERPSQFPDSLLIGQSKSFYRIMTLIEKVKDREAPVFIYGESGTGKELVARAIHFRGGRRKGKFMAVNCGAIPDSLLESELFGYTKGAFTGALRNKPGLIEEADGGTFFLDEIGDLSPNLQAKLLRLLQEKEIRRIGENHTRRVNVRFISATNKNIEEEIERENFRQDLYYRLKIITIELPPLRERREDLLSLLNYFLERYCREMKRERSYFSPLALELLLDYSWPGNVRELQSEIQRCLILSEEDCLIKENYLSPKINPQRESYKKSSYDFFQVKADFEKRFLNQALVRWNYNRTKTAKEIGLTRQGLFKLIKKHNITLPGRAKNR